jgi:glycosyltransferase involved in cell wall biosynthesis
MFPPSIVADQSVEKWFFIDQTLLQLFDYYGYRTLAGRRIVQDSLYREKEGYLAATGIIANSKWAARDVIDNYGVPPSRVHVVQLGANITPEDYSLWEREAASSHLQLGSRALRLVFVGKDWRRKGLDRLIRALQMARRAGSTASLRVIGCAREDVSEDLRNAQGVQWMGFIDKGINPIRFLSSVSECDLGCLLSRSEAGGIGLLEYHALGLAVLGPLTGGTPEGAIDGASILCSPAMPDEEIADLLLSLDRDRSRVEQMRAISWAQRRTVLWENSLSQLRAFWPYPHENAVVVEDTPIL